MFSTTVPAEPDAIGTGLLATSNRIIVEGSVIDIIDTGGVRVFFDLFAFFIIVIVIAACGEQGNHADTPEAKRGPMKQRSAGKRRYIIIAGGQLWLGLCAVGLLVEIAHFHVAGSF